MKSDSKHPGCKKVVTKNFKKGGGGEIKMDNQGWCSYRVSADENLKFNNHSSGRKALTA